MSLTVVTAYYNPNHSKVREKLFYEFVERMIGNVDLIVVTLNEPDVAIFSPWSGYTLQHYPLSVDTLDPLFYKETLLNVGFSKLFPHEDKIAWIDCDVAFTNPNWVTDAIKALEVYDVVQLFSQCFDLNVQYGMGGQTHHSFAACLQTMSREYQMAGLTPYGFAWAARREFLDRTGGLCDKTPFVTAGDDFTAWALVHEVETWAARLPRRLPHSDKPIPKWFMEPWIEWQCRAGHPKVGYVPGLLYHYWHGSRSNRGYDEQWNIVRRYPEADYALARQENGVYSLASPSGNLHRDLIQLITNRREDA